MCAVSCMQGASLMHAWFGRYPPLLRCAALQGQAGAAGPADVWASAECGLHGGKPLLSPFFEPNCCRCRCLLRSCAAAELLPLLPVFTGSCCCAA